MRSVWMRLGLIGLVAGLALPACKKYEDTPPPKPRAVTVDGPSERRAPAVEEKEPFLFARASRVKAPVPARFGAALPVSLAQFRGDWSGYPPRSMVEAGLCTGDVDMQARFLAAVRKAAAAGSVDETLAANFVGLLGYCADDAKCDWLLAATGREKVPAVKRVLYAGLARCTKDRFASAFERDDAPAQAILDWIAGRYGRAPKKWNPQLPRVARELLDKGERHQILRLAQALGKFTGPEPIRLITRLQKQTEDPEHRALLAVGLKDHPDKRAKAMFKAACAHPKVSQDYLCKPAQPLGVEPVPEPEHTGLAAEVRRWDFSPSALIEKDPEQRALIVAALVDCLRAKADREYVRQNCLANLSALDRKRTVAEVKKADPALWKSARSRTMLAAVLRFPEAGGLEARLAELGLLPKTGKKPAPGKAGLTARAILENTGRAIGFDTETGQFPNQHDGLLKELAGLADEAMKGAVFEEIPPKGPREPYRLRGYLDGERWEVTARNLGDWYDMAAVLGLLDTMLRDTGSPIRYVSLPTGDQTASVLAGPADGLLAAAEEGLIHFAGADDARKTGKAFEDKVFEQLKAEGKHVVRDAVIDGVVTE